MRYLRTTLMIAALAGLTACTMADTNPNPPKMGSLTQHLTMVDAEGKIYGIVELDPITGGRIWDSQNRLIGRIVVPAPTVPSPTGAPAN